MPTISKFYSRDSDREREESRSKKEEKRRERGSKRSRSRSRSPRERDENVGSRKIRERNEKEKESSTSSSKKKKGEIDIGEIVNSADKDKITEKLDQEIQKRREKVEKWREQQKKLQEKKTAEGTLPPPLPEEAKPSSSWTLEGEDDDEDNVIENGNGTVKDENMGEMVGNGVVNEQNETTNGASLSDERMDTTSTNTPSTESVDEDPLDAYMAEISQKARAGAENKKARVVVIGAVSKSAPNKGDIVEPEDEKEQAQDELDVEQTASSLLVKGRMLAQTDHTKVYYRPFRKEFYIEVPEIAKMTKKEVEDYREELDEIHVRGKNVPKPIKNWSQCGVDIKVMNVLKVHNYQKPTPIQAQAIPAIMSGRDVIGIAKTGSGKTLAFLIPMFRHILDQPPLEDMDGPIALIMSPTRELALQTWKEANKFARNLGIRVVCVYGGVAISEQIAELKKGAEVVVCTPGRMIDMLAANNGKVTNLRRVTYLVMDEADRMFDMGFEPQVMKMVNNVRPDRQTVLFSATFPKTMEALARKVLERPVEIVVGGRSVVCKDVEQHALVLEEHQKFLKLLELLGQYWEHGNVLVFVEKQEKADDLVSQLMLAGYNCAPLHGGIDQDDRDFTIFDFKTGRLKLMVATSVAARGLDVKKLILVVNYDAPNHYEDYVHRVGRTGRAGNKGYAYTFVLATGQEKIAGEVVRAFETAGIEPPEDLKKLWEEYKTKMAEEGKEIHIGGGGYSGSGFRYDEIEDESEMNKRKLTKLMHGIESGMDDESENIDDQLIGMMKSSKRVTTRRAGAGWRGKPDPSTEKKVEAARAMAEQIAAKLGQASMEKDATHLTAEAIMKGTEAQPVNLTGISLAKQKAMELNEKLDYLPSDFKEKEAEQQIQYFEEELEINDFPQMLRFRVCSREVIAQIQEFVDVGISVKGTHYPLGKEPKPGQDRKLYLFIEARDELSLRRAKEEVVRIMRETLRMMAAQGLTRQVATGGRYKL
uniref:RNA helicase n=1 Tax=Meloidogyne incognita TaxID=6306 RepID=A0A914KK22_MELIC